MNAKPLVGAKVTDTCTGKCPKKIFTPHYGDDVNFWFVSGPGRFKKYLRKKITAPPMEGR